MKVIQRNNNMTIVDLPFINMVKTLQLLLSRIGVPSTRYNPE